MLTDTIIDCRVMKTDRSGKIYDIRRKNMLYEAIIETIVPLGPEPMQKHFEEIETDDPVEYVKTHCKFPIMEIDENRFGEKVITCGDGSGYVTRYIFSE